MNLKTGGLYAAGAVLLGAIGLFAHDFALQWQPVAADIPSRAVLASLSAAILIIGGLMAVWPKTRAYGAGLLAGFYGLWVLILHLPGALKSPGNLGLWLGVFEILALTAGGAIFVSLSGGQRPPAALGQVAQDQVADADAQQVDDGQLDQFAHPADLAVAAFLRMNFSCWRPTTSTWAGRSALVQLQAVAQQGQLLVGDPAVDPDQIFLLQLGGRADHRLGHHPVLREDQQAARIHVQAPDRGQRCC
jgi:hypothetical protein